MLGEGVLGKETKGADDAMTEGQVVDYIREYIETDYLPVELVEWVKILM